MKGPNCVLKLAHEEQEKGRVLFCVVSVTPDSKGHSGWVCLYHKKMFKPAMWDKRTKTDSLVRCI